VSQSWIPPSCVIRMLPYETRVKTVTGGIVLLLVSTSLQYLLAHAQRRACKTSETLHWLHHFCHTSSSIPVFVSAISKMSDTTTRVIARSSPCMRLLLDGMDCILASHEPGRHMLSHVSLVVPQALCCQTGERGNLVEGSAVL
jgi:hypothetical protein